MTRLTVFVWSVLLIQISYVIWCKYAGYIGDTICTIPSYCCTLLVISSGISSMLSKKLRKFWFKEIF